MDSDLEVVLTTGPTWFEERLEDRLAIGTDQRRCTASNGDQLLGLHAQDDTGDPSSDPSRIVADVAGGCLERTDRVT